MPCALLLFRKLCGEEAQGCNQKSAAMELSYLANKTMTKIGEGPLFHKPKSFIAAKNVLYASIITGILIIVMHYLLAGEVDNSVTTGFVLIAIEYIILFLIIKQMALCRKWARTIVPVMCIVINATYIFLFVTEPAISFLETGLFAIQLLLQITAVVFLYKEECNIWFNNKTTGMLP